MTRPEIDVVGYASIDRVRTAAGVDREVIGGAAIYAALSAARMGVRPRLHVAVGEDFPDEWLARLGALGIDTRYVVRRGGSTRRTVLDYDATEQRRDSTRRSAQWWERTEALLPPVPVPSAAVHLLCPMPAGRVAEYHSDASGITIADTSEVFAAQGPSVLPCFGGMEIFAPSLDEAALLAGDPDEDRIVDALLQFVPTLILKRGVRGLLHCHGPRRTVSAADPVVAVDPTGAGDATIGAIAAALALGLEVEEQLAAGAAAGALTVGGVGPESLGWRD